MMRLFFVLVICLGITWINIHRFIVSKDKLFLTSVSGNCFRKNNINLCFLKDDETIVIKDDDKVQNLKLVSVYTSSKAIYHFSDGYIGVVIVDTTIYTTKISSSIRRVDFNTIYYSGVISRYI